MATDTLKRKLTAVVHADVKGYSHLMEEDEEATFRTLSAYRTELARMVGEHRGRVVDTAGDGFLLEFSSVVDAVSFAVSFQEEIRARNAHLPENRRMEFRIGINVGDVIENGDNIFGDGVNIAARLEGLAEPGGICISGTAYDHVKKKLNLGYEFLGEQYVKNIADPVPTYRVLSEPAAPTTHPKAVRSTASRRRMRHYAIALVGVLAVVAIALGIWILLVLPGPTTSPDISRKPAPAPSRDSADKPIPSPARDTLPRPTPLPLPDKPSVAVLPFANTSGDPQQEYFSDGMTDEIINGLSRSSQLFVIARHSVFAFKGKAPGVKELGEELGVRYLLEGSAGKSQGRVEIKTRLIEAQSGRQVWSEWFDRGWKEIFSLQEEIVARVVKAMGVDQTKEAHARPLEKPRRQPNLQAYDKVLQAELSYSRFSKQANHLARQLYEEAVSLDPEYAIAYAGLAATHMADRRNHWTDSPRESFQQFAQCAFKAHQLDSWSDITLIQMSLVHLLKRQHDQALRLAEKAVRLNPNGADALYNLGKILSYTGEPEKAIALIERAMRLNPFPPVNYYRYLAQAYKGAKQYDRAVEACRKGLAISPRNAEFYLVMATTFSLAGRLEKARNAAARLRRLRPAFSLSQWKRITPYKNRAELMEDYAALSKAGLQ